MTTKETIQETDLSPKLEKLLVDELRDLLHAEGQLVKALPKMAKAAQDSELRAAFESHLTETENQVERLREAFRYLGVKPTAKTCKAMQGLVAEGEETISDGEEKESHIADLALIASAQKVEHYEISGYGSSIAMAKQIGNASVAKLLRETQDEESNADKTLTGIASRLLGRVAKSAA